MLSFDLAQKLVQKGIITQQQLDYAMQHDKGGQLEELLIGWDLVTKEQIDELSAPIAPPPPPMQPIYNPPPPPIAPQAPDLTMDKIQTSKFKMDLKTIIYLGSLLVTAITTYFGFTMELNSRFDALEDVDSSAMIELERKFTELENKFTPIGDGVYSVDPTGTWPPSRGEFKMKDELSRNKIGVIEKEIEKLLNEIDKLESKLDKKADKQ